MSLDKGCTARRLNQVVFPEPGSPMVSTTKPRGARGLAACAAGGGVEGDSGCVSCTSLPAGSAGAAASPVNAGPDSSGSEPASFFNANGSPEPCSGRSCSGRSCSGRSCSGRSCSGGACSGKSSSGSASAKRPSGSAATGTDSAGLSAYEGRSGAGWPCGSSCPIFPVDSESFGPRFPRRLMISPRHHSRMPWMVHTSAALLQSWCKCRAAPSPGRAASQRAARLLRTWTRSAKKAGPGCEEGAQLWSKCFSIVWAVAG